VERPLLVRARVRTMAATDEAFDWLLAEGGTITGLGLGPVPDELVGRSDVLDFDGLTVLPALHDGHVHFLETGLTKLDLDLGVARKRRDVLGLIESAASEHRGALLRAHSFDPDLLPDGSYISRAELDAIAPDTAVLVRRRDGHSCVVNGRAADLLEVEGLDGVETDGGGGPTGVLRREANTRAVRRAMDLLTREERVRCFHLAAASAAGRGVGIVHALAGNREPHNRDTEILLETEPDLPIDIVVYAQTHDVDRVAALGLPRIGGCLLIDGSFSSGTAALEEPYADGGGRGTLYYDEDELVGFFRSAHERGMQASVHAIGDRAITQALACFEKACGSEAGAARHRIEHFELASPAHIATMARLGMGACVQPTFELLWGDPGGMIETRLGPERARLTNPFRSILASGVHLGGGSDSYVTPMDSLLGIHAAVNRPNAAQRLDVFDAVRLFTSGVAWLSFDEGRRGTLETGKEASFVVLRDDPFGVDPARIRDIEVAGLYLRGHEVTVA